MTKKRKFHKYTVLILLSIFGIFLTSAWEDQTFRDWKKNNLSLYHQYKDIEYFCHRDLNIDERFFMDLSVMLNVQQPFDKKLFGPIRRFVYLKIASEMNEVIHLLRNGESGIQVARTGSEKKFEFIGKQAFVNIIRLDRNDIPKIRDFMFVYNINYYVCYFESYEWTQKKSLLEGHGFSLVYNNLHFMLFKVLK